MSTPTVISLGAGVQSTALALMLANGDLDLDPVVAVSIHKRKAGAIRSQLGGGPPCLDGLERPRVAIFADTQWEPAATYAHLDRLTDALAAAPHPIEVRRITAGNIREDAVGRATGERARFANLPLYITGGKGKSPEGKLRRQCTREYKIDPIRRELRALGHGPKAPVATLIGISIDEVQRVKPGDGWEHRAHPLVEHRLSRHDLELYLERHGWGRVPKSACIGCPFHGDKAWRDLRDNSPAEWEDAVEFDAAIRRLPMLEGDAYLHRSLKPLADVDLTTREDLGQLDLFADECEGMCGV
jgi:hypothetical protein